MFPGMVMGSPARDTETGDSTGLCFSRIGDGGEEVPCLSVDGVCVTKKQPKLSMGGVNPNDVKVDVQPEDDKTARAKYMRALFAEMVGTALMVIIGCGCVCSTLTGAYQGIVQVAIVWGFGVALAIYTTAEASGAHLNPAITLAFLLVRPKAHGMTKLKAFLYIIAQLSGAILGASINLGVYSSTIASFERSKGIVRGEPKSVLSASAFGEYFPNPGLSTEFGAGPYNNDDVSVVQALLVEAWGTFILAFVIFCITHQDNKVFGDASRPGVPFMIGATVSVLLALYAPITQAGWNPARDFGPRLVAFFGGWGQVAIPGPKSGFWIYIAGPCFGAPLGAAFAEFVLWRRCPNTPI